MKKWILRLIIGVILAPQAVLIVWYSISFLLHLDEINRLVKSGNKKVEPIFHSFYPFAVAGETKEGIRTYAMRKAYASLVYSKNRKGMDSWHLNNMLWYLASHIHLTDQEVFGLWVNCSLYDCNKGLSEASRVHYGKQLKDLSIQEQAGLVALVRSPSRYKVGSEQSKNQIQEIIKKAEAHNNANSADAKSRAAD